MPATDTKSDDIVVDLEHAELVCHELGQLVAQLEQDGVHLEDSQFSVSEPNPALGLALVPIRYQILPTSAAEPGRTAQDSARRIITGAVRDSFRDKFGWAPTMDIDHHVDHVGGLQHALGPSRFVGAGEVTPVNWVVGGGSGFPIPTRQPDAITSPESTDERVRIGVLDTKLFANPVLFGSCLANASTILVPGDEPLSFLAGHATFVAGLIQQKAPSAAIEVHEVFFGTDELATTWSVACAMAALADARLDIMNLSLGCFTDDNEAPLALTRAVELLTPQTVVVAAGGNYRGVKYADGSSPAPRPFWPAAMDNVVAVGADVSRGSVAEFSVDYPWVDAYASGSDVASTYLSGKVAFPAPDEDVPSNWPGITDFDGYARWSGTSFAAAKVTGAIAALTLPGHRTAREALQLLLTDPEHRDPEVRAAASN